MLASSYILYGCSILFVYHLIATRWPLFGRDTDTPTHVYIHTNAHTRTITHTELLSPGTILIDACTAVSKQFVPLLPTEWEGDCLPSLLYHEPPLHSSPLLSSPLLSLHPSFLNTIHSSPIPRAWYHLLVSCGTSPSCLHSSITSQTVAPQLGLK